MYRLCDHISVNGEENIRCDSDRDVIVGSINNLPLESLEHLLDCLPLDYLSKGNEIVGSLRLGIQRLIKERVSIGLRGLF